MKRSAFWFLLAALGLVTLAVPLLFTFAPAGLACFIEGSLLVVLALPDLARRVRSSESAGPASVGLPAVPVPGVRSAGRITWSRC